MVGVCFACMRKWAELLWVIQHLYTWPYCINTNLKNTVFHIITAAYGPCELQQMHIKITHRIYKIMYHNSASKYKHNYINLLNWQYVWKSGHDKHLDR